MEGHMKRNNIKILTTLLALSLLLFGCIHPDEPEDLTTTLGDVNQTDKNTVGGYQTMQYTYLTNVNPATVTTNLNPAYLLLVNMLVSPQTPESTLGSRTSFPGDLQAHRE